jgi:excinuclease ABC subunit A
MGPGGGPEGGRILAAGAPGEVAHNLDSVTRPWLAEYLRLAAVSG